MSEHLGQQGASPFDGPARDALAAAEREKRSLPERRDPTHTLTIEVPLNLEANPAAESYDIQGALGEALGVVLRLARLGTLGLLCADPNVTLEEVDG